MKMFYSKCVMLGGPVKFSAQTTKNTSKDYINEITVYEAIAVYLKKNYFWCGVIYISL